MAIIIRNLEVGNPSGVCQYEVRINERRITTFRHNRADSLATCLYKAGNAVAELAAAGVMDMLNPSADQQQWLDLDAFLSSLDDPAA